MAAAVAALAAQEHARRVQEVVDRFRLADATAPERARALADLRVTHVAAAEALAQSGLLVRGSRADTWYLDELAARREAEARAARRRPAAYLVGALLGVLVAGAFVWYIYSQSPTG
ncbi:MAG: hypothetical protein ACXW61_15045 [Gemmatirosa sp.]